MASVVQFDRLKAFVCKLLSAAGCSEFTGTAVATGLCEASLRGTDTHGIKLLNHYLRNIAAGGLNPTPRFTVASPFPAVAVLDADNGPGLAAGCRAVDVGINIASSMGAAVVLVTNTTHPGALSTFAMRAARRGYVCMFASNTGPKMVSHGGRRAFFGTNPWAFGAPVAGGEPMVVDMATTAIPWNKVQQGRATGITLPSGVVVDDAGLPTTDPHAADALTPPGPAGAHKGYALAAMVETLSCILTDMAWGHHTIEMYRNESSLKLKRGLGHWCFIMRPDAKFLGTNTFATKLRSMRDELRAEPALPGHSVMLPGDPEEKCAARRRVDGIPVDYVTVADLSAWAKRFNIEAPFETVAPTSKL